MRAEELLQTLGILSDEAKNLIQTFYVRMDTLYEHKKIVHDIVNGLSLYKKDPSEGARKFILGKLDEVRTKILPAFRAIKTDLPVIGTEQAEHMLQQELYDFEQLEKDFRDAAPEARKKIAEILKEMKEEISQQKENVKIIEHTKDVVRLAEGFLRREQELIAHEVQLIQKTEADVKTIKTEMEYDSLAYEWKTFIEELEQLLRQEKRDVIDHMGPLLSQRATISGRINRLLKPFKWIREKRKPLWEEEHALLTGKKITKEDIAKDIEAFTTPGETQQYQAMLMRHLNLLDDRARDFLVRGGLAAGKRSVLETKKLTNLAYIDPLTGLYRKKVLEQRLKEEIAQTRRDSKKLSLVFIDIDHFKKFNDTYGHKVGDQVLAFIALRIKRVLMRESDIACRYGGEEMVLLLVDTDKNGATEVANRILVTIREESKILMQQINTNFSETIKPEDRIHQITASFGVATYPEDKDLLQIADARLYKAKAAGRNQVVSS